MVTETYIIIVQVPNIYPLFLACICSIHFEGSCFETSYKQKLPDFASKNWRDLKANAVPTLYLEGITMRQAENIEHYIEEQKRRKIDIDIDIGDITISNLNVKEEILTEPNTEESTDVLTSLELLETDENDNIETIQLYVDENRNM